MSKMGNCQFQYGKLAKQYCNKELPLQVLRSAAGYYIGTASEDGPCSRESSQYYRYHLDACNALQSGNWSQKLYP